MGTAFTNSVRRLAMILAACCAGAGPLDPPGPRKPVMLEPGVGDMGPLSATNRVMPMDLREPSGFDRVYSLGKGADGQIVYARANGGLVATFRQADYMNTPYGKVSAVPPGTVFRIGRLSDFMVKPEEDGVRPDRSAAPGRSAAQSAIRRWAPTSPGPDRAAQSAGLSAGLNADAHASEADDVSHTMNTSESGQVWNSELYRRSRLCDLIDLAMRQPSAPR